MAYLLAFGVFCICGWYCIKGTAFMASVTAGGWGGLVVITGSLTGHVSDLYRVAVGIAVACAPWCIREAIGTDWRAFPGGIVAHSVAQVEQRKAERAARQARRLLPRR